MLSTLPEYVRRSHSELPVGVALCGYATSSAELALQKILQKHRAGGACADFPASLAQHAWRYRQEDLEKCLHPVLCPDIPVLGHNKHVSEDCLQLHVYAPQRPAKLRPVFVFLIPGGFTGTNWFQGSWYDAARFVVRNEALFVSVGYRSGYLGHWAHEELAREAGDGAMGNYEAMDQRLALQWVQRNIETFGGDPGRVTLVGHSSGAFSVQPLGPSEFIEDALSFYDTLTRKLNCHGTGAEQVACLRALPHEAFYQLAEDQVSQDMAKLKALGKWGLAQAAAEAAWSALGFKGSFHPVGLQDLPITATPLFPALPTGFVVDGSPRGLPRAPRELYEAGEVNPAKVYLNHGTDEGTIFAGLMYAAYPWYKAPEVTHAATDQIMSWALNASILELYPHGRGSLAPFYRLSRAISDSTFLCPHRRFAKAMSRRPNSTFYAETTFAGGQANESHNWFSSKPGDTGFDRAPWLPEDELMHQLVNCHYALFAHCGSPDATSDTACAQNVLKMHSCQSTFQGGQLRPAPFPPYEAAPGAARFALTPLVDGESRWVTPTDEENLKRRRGDVFFVVIGQIRLEKKHVLNYIELIEDSLRISD
eukprot:g10765.t1